MRLASRRTERSNAPSTIRRYRDVAAVLLAHGLADVVDALHLVRPAAWGARALPARVRIDPSLSRAARFRLTLEELGPTFVKFGQALSVRADLLPEELIGELTKLQEHVAPLEPGVAEAAVEAEFGAPLAALFRSFEPTPLASASIRGRVRTGSRRAAAGKSQACETPTRSSPAPIANAISVADGTRDATRGLTTSPPARPRAPAERRPPPRDRDGCARRAASRRRGRAPPSLRRPAPRAAE